METMTRERLEKWRELIYGAKIAAYTMGSTNPAKQEKIDRMKELTDELQRLFDEITEGIL